MSKLVLAVLMFFGTTLCWADPVHRSNIQDACAPEDEQNQWEQEEQEIEEQQFFEQFRAERAAQRAQREVVTTTTVNNEIIEQVRLTEIIIRMEAETDVRVMGLTERQQRGVIRNRQITAGARIIEQNLLTMGQQTPEQRLAGLTPRTGELRARIARLELERTPEWRAEQERLRAEQERQIAVGLEFQARQRQAARMMEEVERLRENGWTMGCSVM